MSSYDLWGRQIEVAEKAGEGSPAGIVSPRDAFLTLNSLYLNLIESGATTDDHHVQKPECYRAVRATFEASGLSVQEYSPDIARFETFLEQGAPLYRGRNNYLEGQGGMGGYFPQKAFEHWISAEFLQWKPGDRVLDFAAWISPATEVLAGWRPADFFVHDITFKTDLEGKRVSGFSDAIEAPDSHFDYIMAHCAIDNFESDYDTKFFKEALRILKPGGKLLITPLHMSAKYENRVAIGSKGLEVDPGASIVIGNPGSLRFARLYSVPALRRRLVDAVTGLRYSVVHVNGLPLEKYPATCTNRFMLLAQRPE
jgi:SAM-dependent methyltransferase